VSKLDTDRYYDGGIIPGELTDRELEAMDAQQAADNRSALLNEALVGIVQVRASLAEAERYTRLAATDSPLVAQVQAGHALRTAEMFLKRAGAKA